MDSDVLLSDIGNSLDEIVKPEMRQAYEVDKKNWFSTDKNSKRTPGLFKPEIIGTRGVWLTPKCYLVQNEAGKNKYRCKGVSKKHNDLNFERNKYVSDVLQKIKIES